MGDDQRNFEHRQCGDVECVGVHDALHVGAGAIDPGVKAVGGIGHTVSGQDSEVLVDQSRLPGGDLVEAQAESLSVERAGLLGPGGDLSGQPRVVSTVE